MTWARLLLLAALAASPCVHALAAQDAPKTVAAWTKQAEQGDHEAQAHLCALYFDGQGGTFDAQKAATSCQSAATSGDASSMWRMGLLSLAGVGTPKDPGAAARLCAQAGSHDATVPAGFCLAAIASERSRTGGLAAQDEAPAKPSGDPAPSDAIAHWRDLADRGDRTATGHLCDAYFDAGDGAFDASRAADWCRRAAGYGDGEAMRRLGLMHFWGVGMEKSSPAAEALCVAAHARDDTVSPGFCVAAVKAERASAEAALTPSRSVYPQAWPAASGLASLPSALGPDRVLETVHATADGLRYNCRDLINSSRYGLQLDGLMFGRSILQFEAPDYAALDTGAAECAAAIAPYDQDGSQRRELTAFRALLPTLKKRQQDLTQHAAASQAEVQQQKGEYAERNRDFQMIVVLLSPTQTQCIDAVRRAWQARRFSPGAHAMEIRSASTDQVNGNTVVSGNARVIGNQLQDYGTATTYTCTFDGQSRTIVSTSVVPAAAATTASP